MTGTLLAAFILGLVLSTLYLFVCETDVARTARRRSDLADAKEQGTHRAPLQYPHIDLSRCLGCATCVRACPEHDVLDIVHGQSAVLHGSRCVGHGLCAKECPVGAIHVALGDLEDRRDIPILTEKLEVEDVPGLFLAGEVTGFALIRTAISHGTTVADEVANRLGSRKETEAVRAISRSEKVLDLCIVGAGPAGLAASLQAKSRGLNFATLEQESIGGTVAKYPRRKLVITQPVVLPCHGRLRRTSYVKEELMELWEGVARKYQLPIQCKEEFRGLKRTRNGDFLLHTNRGEYRCRFVCLALGRRGTPRKLGVPGEGLSKVMYCLVDAQSFQGQRILVVGGGDSAVEAAIGLARQPGNKVTLSYRKTAFWRIKACNAERLSEALEQNNLQCVYASEVTRITQGTVHLQIKKDPRETVERVLENDYVFVMAGGIPPVELLEASGVCFDPARRPASPPLTEKGTGLGKALLVAAGLSLLTLTWFLFFGEYYGLPHAERPLSSLHSMLRPSSPFGLTCGILATALIVGNLAYLARRASLGNWIPGSLRAWMTVHVVTGVLAVLLALVHGAMAPRDTVGGQAYWTLVILLITGAIGRYFYSLVPRAIQGREMELEEIQSKLAAEFHDCDRYGVNFGESIREEIYSLVTTGKWKRDFFRRLLALVRTQRRLRELLNRVRERGLQQGLSEDRLPDLLSLAKRAYRTALQSAHREDLTALLASWRFFHRWVALLMILLAIAHIVTALRYTEVIVGA